MTAVSKKIRRPTRTTPGMVPAWILRRIDGVLMDTRVACNSEMLMNLRVPGGSTVLR